MSYTLRPARKEDVYALSALAGETFRDGWASVIGAEMADAYVAEYLTIDHFYAEIVNPTNYVVLAVDETDALIGYAELKTARPVPELVTLPRPVVLQRLYVARVWRGTGVADALLTNAEAEALRRGFASLYLEADPNNERAWRYYIKRGFTESGRTVYHYPGGTNDNIRLLVRPICPNGTIVGN